MTKRTPSIMRKYSALILFTSLVDCTAAFMSLMATAIVESHEGSIVFVYLGPCSLIHDKFCYVALASHVQSIGESCVLLLVSFSYRLWSFRLASSNNGPVSDSRAPLIILCLLASIPAVITTVTFSFSASPPTPSLLEHPQLSGRLFSVFNMSAPSLLSSINILPRISIGYIIFLYLAATPALFVIRRLLYQKICSLGSITDSSRHREIFRALTLHMFMPVTFSVGFVFWLLDFFDVCHSEALQRSIMPISSTFAIISPLIVIFHLPPYRKFFMGIVWPCSQKVIDSQRTSVSVISKGGMKTSLVNSRFTRVT
ncbi:hypothetical protein PRIPAC_77923 [Pristionchus pacificus]|nr:hypothetical protein PRIPAC_77923 [Pristionchus pacificus]